MSKVKGTGHNIAWAVAYKAATDLVSNGIIEFETEDVGAELAELADVLFEHYSGAAAGRDASWRRRAPKRWRRQDPFERAFRLIESAGLQPEWVK